MAKQIGRLIASAKSGDSLALLVAKYLTDELNYLKGLESEPEEDTATLKRVRQSGKYPIWRLSHGFDKDAAVRLICWFPPESNEIVLAVLYGDKKKVGDVFYDSVGARADQIIENWIRENNWHGNKF